ncbi:hypothetical protein Bca52824_070634 [Brassica carinata]|uniref:Uncharacterized protein n=1 Tax=Brassica carinata TaxID=52824 RepID=A0A8X7Q4W4_BRACI|nr:hypothetical protein Bca52824_070634 [Brassica carinata]
MKIHCLSCRCDCEELENRGEHHKKRRRKKEEGPTRKAELSNYGVKELTWENGQLTVHGLGEGVEPTTSANLLWTQALNGCETLESVVHQAALQPSKTQLQSQKERDHNNPRARTDPVQENAVIPKK